ncbi:hypothetical protein Emed_003296 [Eimeria media]
MASSIVVISVRSYIKRERIQIGIDIRSYQHGELQQQLDDRPIKVASAPHLSPLLPVAAADAADVAAAAESALEWVDGEAVCPLEIPVEPLAHAAAGVSVTVAPALSVAAAAAGKHVLCHVYSLVPGFASNHRDLYWGFNLARTARMDYQPPPLFNSEPMEKQAEEAMKKTFTNKASCDSSAEGLTPATMNGFYVVSDDYDRSDEWGKNLVQNILEHSLTELEKTPASGAVFNPEVAPFTDPAVQNLASIMYPESTGVGCVRTDNCDDNKVYILCRFASPLVAGELGGLAKQNQRLQRDPHRYRYRHKSGCNKRSINGSRFSDSGSAAAPKAKPVRGSSLAHGGVRQQERRQHAACGEVSLSSSKAPGSGFKGGGGGWKPRVHAAEKIDSCGVEILPAIVAFLKDLQDAFVLLVGMSSTGRRKVIQKVQRSYREPAEDDVASEAAPAEAAPEAVEAADPKGTAKTADAEAAADAPDAAEAVPSAFATTKRASPAKAAAVRLPPAINAATRP